MNMPTSLTFEEEKEIEEDFILKVMASLQQDDSVIMPLVIKGIMFILEPRIQKTTSKTTSPHHNKNLKNLKVL